MAARSAQRRKTAARKKRQTEDRRLAQLREQMLNYEGFTARQIVRMSPQELERRARIGGRRRMVTPVDGLALAIAAAGLSARWGR